jgi:Protein of unknown function (DUF1353)
MESTMKRRATKANRRANLDHGSFSGDPETIWMTEGEPDRHMKLLKTFSFRDPKDRKWVAPSNYVIDGATIPRALWSLVGSPYTGDYRRASIVHDKACDDAAGNSNARRAADRMFYHACRAGGCSVREATLLYIGVRIGALVDDVPAWRAADQLGSTAPRISRSAVEERLEADFRLAAELVLSQGEPDDPKVIEERTEHALSAVSGVDLRRR